VRACFVFSHLLRILQYIFGGMNSTRLYLYDEESNIISECHLNAIAGIIFANRNILLKVLLLIIPLKNMQHRFVFQKNVVMMFLIVLMFLFCLFNEQYNIKQGRTL